MDIKTIPKRLFLCFKERRLPVRLQHRVTSHLVFKNVLETPRLECNPQSDTSIHSLVCHKDLYMYLLAIKSFLRFYNDVSVVVHDDGSLKKDDIRLLRKHIKDIRVFDKKKADKLVNAKLGSYVIEKRNSHPFYIKLIDPNILSKSKKKIILDSDIIFLKKATDVIKWIQNDNNYPFYNKGNLKNPFRFKGEMASVPKKFNAGFVGFNNKLGIKEIEKTIKLIEGNLVCKECAFLTEQAAYSFLLSKRGAKPLDMDKYFIEGMGGHATSIAEMIHFTSLGRFTRSIFSRLAKKVIEELKQDGHRNK